MNRLLWFFAFLVIACSDESGGDEDPLRPSTLAGTGLCLDVACTQLASDALEYEPRFALWSDTAAKRRWLQLPAGTKIDTSDMNHWIFPVGTKLWKEFSRDGTRVETRYMVKLQPSDTRVDDWYYAAYVWNAAQDETTRSENRVSNANGTQHDVPSRRDCVDCHQQQQHTPVLGASAIQLDWSSASVDLDDLIQRGLLTAPLSGSAPRFPLPGTQVDQAALGYLHANCGNCHNPTSFNFNDTAIDLRLDTTKLATVTGTPAYSSTVNAPIVRESDGPQVVLRPGNPDGSAMVFRMNSRTDDVQMPPMASESVDPVGLAAVRAWISAL